MIFKKNYKYYRDSRFQKETKYSINCINGKVSEFNSSTIEGKICTILFDDKVGVASSDKYGTYDDCLLLKKAYENATKSYEYNSIRNKNFNPIYLYNDFRHSGYEVKQKNIKWFIKDIDSYILNRGFKVKNRGIYITWYEFEKEFKSSSEICEYYFMPRVELYITLGLEHDGIYLKLHEFIDGIPKDFLKDINNIYIKIDKLYENLMLKKNAVNVSEGNYQCVIDPSFSGLLAHETVGHLAEADINLVRRENLEMLNSIAANPSVNIIDYANLVPNQITPCPIYVDDEGTIARDVNIINNGVLKDLMNNVKTAKQFGTSETGNTRASTFLKKPRIRMRNTGFLEGTNDLRVLIESIEDGYYLVTPGHGQTDLMGNFKIDIPLGFKIKNGKILSSICNAVAYSNVLSFMNSISMVGNKSRWTGGICTKKDDIYVGMGGPALRCQLKLHTI